VAKVEHAKAAFVGGRTGPLAVAVAQKAGARPVAAQVVLIQADPEVLYRAGPS